jgi:hypothetical protein
MKSDRSVSAPLRVLLALTLLLPLVACSALRHKQPTATTQPASVPVAPRLATPEAYLELLGGLAPGDAMRQATTLMDTLSAAQQSPTATHRLRYAIALGAAGHPSSNPVEARRLIGELLAEQNDLRPHEIDLANVFLREFDARVELYAELAREREDAGRKLLSADAESDRRYNALNAETQRLRKALAEAERKLEAVAEMERSLLEERSTDGQ